MRTIFRKVFFLEFVLVDQDDIVVFSNTTEDHDRRLKVVMDQLRTEKFYCYPAKSAFYMSTTTFLGFAVGNGKILVDSTKAATFQRIKPPRCDRPSSVLWNSHLTFHNLFLNTSKSLVYFSIYLKARKEKGRNPFCDRGQSNSSASTS